MRRGLLWVLLGVLLATAAPAAGAPASPRSPSTAAAKERKAQVDRRIGQLAAQVAEASAEERSLLVQLDASDDRRRSLNVTVAGLDGELAAAQARAAAAQARLDELEAQLQRTRFRLDRSRRDLANARRVLEARALAAYTGGPAVDAYAGALLAGGDHRDRAARLNYLGAILRDQSAAVARYRQERDSLAGLRISVEEVRAGALAQRDVVVAEEATLADRRAAADAVRRQVQAELAERERLLAQVRRSKAEFTRQLAALQAESNAIAALLRRTQKGQGVAPSGRGVLASPIPGAPVTSPYGPRVHPIFGDVRMHTGVDFEADFGVPIRAAADGVVLFAGPRGGYGTATLVDHGGSLATLYAHQSRLAVAEGQHVTRGQLIGFAGASGYSTGPHLHFEVRQAGTPVDPMRYL